METTQNLILDYTIFCEDVRVEASNHLSLMGVIHQAVVPQLPVTMIKFAVLNHWRGEGRFMTEVRILTPDRMQTVAMSQPDSSSRPTVTPTTSRSSSTRLFTSQAITSCRH